MQLRALEKRISFFYICGLSMILLLLSCFFLWNTSNDSLFPQSVLVRMLANNTSFAWKTVNNDSDQNNHPYRKVSPPGPADLNTLRTEISLAPATGSEDEMRINSRRLCDSDHASLRVYMYDLPPTFHFGLLGWKGRAGQLWPDVSRVSSIPSYPGGLNLQHSIEYWLTLDLLSSDSSVDRPCSALRVMNSSDADVIFVPFFSSLSYNRHSKVHGKEKMSMNKLLQDELVRFLLRQEEWKQSRGKDHLIVAHHPNSMLDARRKLGSAMFVLADFGRYPAEIANIKKDIIAPYRHVVNSLGNESPPFDGRPILMYFQGAIHRKDGGAIRQELYQLLKDEKDVHFSFGTVRRNGISSAGHGMASSKFCLNIAGDTPSSNRLFDAIVSHCVPVIISDDIELPFEDVLDYAEFCVFVRASDAVKKGFLVKLLRRVSQDEWTKMWMRLKQVSHHFEYQYPSREDDAVQMIWGAVARKISSVRLALNREKRFRQSSLDRRS
ncbi:hypothetical protein Taro_029412 [Colocasia esculenta]|uniref:Exostosin GT47 domain-containing protein n=1 Tax=Colocasia esculenta TaxID=4460 RepID=A0A843VDR3_COLES|nr:hypothetical protein [Colocasia esculenta]